MWGGRAPVSAPMVPSMLSVTANALYSGARVFYIYILGEGGWVGMGGDPEKSA